MSESYANDDTIHYTYNDNGDVTAQYHNSNAKPYVTYTYNEDDKLTEKVNTDTGLKYVYGENNNVSVYKTFDNTLVQSYTETETEADETNGIKARADISESHFDIDYSSVVKDKSISYTTGSDTIEYSYQTTGSEEDEKVSSDTVKNGESTVISASYTYDDKGNITEKSLSYGSESIKIVNQYDDKNRIIATGYDGVSVYYTYDNDSQISRVDNSISSEVNYTSTYTYDARGNITSKNVYDYTRDKNITSTPKETTNFTYANFGWKDLLVSVNGVELTYDEVGNVLTYGDKEFTWNTGRNLESIADGDKEYSYTYDENGIRTSKTVNGVTTYFNTKDGVILSQSDGTNTMYFQYDSNGTPLGFIYNGTQYFYMTNNMGDVSSITDAQGNELVQYEYDEWGAIASIYSPHNSESEIAIANANPLRYRGYYYDNETGYYYLQSRYYVADFGRFLNADLPEYAKKQKDSYAGTNLFTYCNNDPVNNSDPTGMIAWVLPAATIAKILITALAVIGIAWTVATIIKNTDYSFVSDMLNELHGKHKLKVVTIQSLINACIKAAYVYAKAIIKARIQAISLAVSVSVADAKLRTIIKKDKKHDYWEAYWYKNIIFLGKGISRAHAISRAKRKSSIFARRKQQARTIAWEAGNRKTPYGPEIHCNGQKGFYWHYHIYRQHSVHSAHMYYL